MNLYSRGLRLIAGYFAGILFFFLYDLFWGDLPAKALIDVFRWLPLDAAYLVVFLVLSGWLKPLNTSTLLGMNGFLIGTIGIFEARPPYMDTMADGCFIIVGELILFLLI